MPARFLISASGDGKDPLLRGAAAAGRLHDITDVTADELAAERGEWRKDEDVALVEPQLEAAGARTDEIPRGLRGGLRLQLDKRAECDDIGRPEIRQRQRRVEFDTCADLRCKPRLSLGEIS